MHQTERKIAEQKFFVYICRYPFYMEMGTIDIRTRQSIAWHFLGAFNKTLDEEQTRLLVEHEGASFPIWLRIAIEELRVYGDFRTVTQKIRDFPGTLEGEMIQYWEKGTNVLRNFGKVGEFLITAR